METTFAPSTQAALWLNDVLAAFETGTHQTPLLIDDEGKPREIPAELLPIFHQIAKDFAAGRPISIVAHDALMTTQQAADFIGVSRPTLITLLEKHNIPFSFLGTHRRISTVAVQSLKVMMKKEQRELVSRMRAEAQANDEYSELS